MTFLTTPAWDVVTRADVASRNAREAPAADGTGLPLLHVDFARPDRDTVVVTPVGEADISTFPDLQRALSGAIALGSHDVVVDLDRLSFLDASTLGALVVAHRQSVAGGGTLRVRCHTRHGRRLLRLTGLDGMLEPLD